MAGTRYQYETSPRKLEPNYQEQKNKREKIHVVKDVPRQEVKISKAQKKKHRKVTLVVLLAFALLLTISYRNAQINEQFTEMQNLKTELSNLQKENECTKNSAFFFLFSLAFFCNFRYNLDIS